MARKPSPQAIMNDATRELRKAGFREVTPEPGSLGALAIEAHARRRSVEIVPEAKPDYILRREKRQAFATLINAGTR